MSGEMSKTRMDDRSRVLYLELMDKKSLSEAVSHIDNLSEQEAKNTLARFVAAFGNFKEI